MKSNITLNSTTIDNSIVELNSTNCIQYNHFNIYHEAVGYGAVICASLLTLPQVYKTYTTKNADSLSVTSLYLNIFTSIFAFSYGFLKNMYPPMVSNTIYFITSIMLLKMSYSYRLTINEENVIPN